MPIVKPRKKEPEQQPPPAFAPTPAVSMDARAMAVIAQQNQRIAEQNEKILTAIRDQVSVSTNKRVRATVERDKEGLITAINMNVVG